MHKNGTSVQKLQIFKTVVLGEMDIAENVYEMMCFAIRMNHNEYVSPDAMAKLRQKNPNTIRSPEEDLGTQEIVLDHTVQISAARNINLNVKKLCGDVDIVHISGNDVKYLFDNNTNPMNYANAVQNITRTMRTKKRCSSVSENNITCVCRLHMCISWYPCDLKYCQGEDTTGKSSEFRCGIKTCGKCRDFDFLASEKNHCFWDNRQKS
ncbi:hypothetical protein QZH41_018617 [Actinostola sp. cb2023]|nr:hypothetical protein QZH41_018617 [Actinostola sp. cb2023]